MSKIWYLYFGIVAGIFITLPADTWNRHEAFALGIGITLMAYFAIRGLVWLRFFYREAWEKESDELVVENCSSGVLYPPRGDRVAPEEPSLRPSPRVHPRQW